VRVARGLVMRTTIGFYDSKKDLPYVR